MKVLTIKTPEGWTYEISTLNVGEVFEGFGGSRHPLVAGRDYYTGEKQKKPTASLVVRSTGPMMMDDKEYDIHAPEVWEWLARLINGGDADAGVVASATGDHDIEEAQTS